MIAVLTALLLISAFFSSVETAFTSLGPGQIRNMAEHKGTRGRLVQKLSGRSDILLTTLLIGNNLANLGASALTTALTIRRFGSAYVAAATGLLTLTVLVFCEVSPKQIALARNEFLCLHSARLVWFLSVILRPLIWLTGGISRLFTRLFTGGQQRKLTLEHLLYHVKAAEGEGVVEPYEEEMVRNVFRINDTPAEAIMTHRTEMFYFREDTTVQDAVIQITESGHTKAPVLKNDLEEVTGMVTLFDLVKAARTGPDRPVRAIASAPSLVPGTMKADDLFFRLKSQAIPMAVVLDEYGGLNGVVTREDVIDEIFGDLYDERGDRSDEPIIRCADGSFTIQGDADFYDVSDVLGLELRHGSRTHTIGGYLLEKLEKIPETGTTLTLPEGRYIITQTERQRIVTVQFRPADPGN